MMSTINVTDERKPLLTTTTTSNNEEVNKKSSTRTTWIIILLSILVTASVIIYYTFGNDKVNNNNKKYVEENEINKYVLPSTKLTVQDVTSSKSLGTFVSDDITTYSWEISTTETFGSITFYNEDKTLGFQYEADHEKDAYKTGSIKLTLSSSTTSPSPSIIVVVVPDAPTEDADRILVTEWIRTSVASKHFIQLSMKLGSLGYLGNEQPIIGKLHNFAKWIYRVMEQDLKLNMEEFKQDAIKVNEIVSSYQQLGHWPTTINELQLTSSLSVSTDESQEHGRSLLGNCEMIDYCDNECFGMCGAGCSCWDWVCGDCSCWLGCYEHDTFCSCDCMLSYCCLNILWVACDGSGSCDD